MLLEWQNLIFLLPMAFALLLLGVSMLGGDGDGDHEAEHHFGGHEMDGVGVDSADASAFSRALDFLGLGRVPVSILIFTWCMLFGFTGLILEHYLLALFLPLRLLNITLSVIVAFISAGLLTSLLARLTGRFVPRLESYGERKEHFINREAEVRYTITSSSGTVTLLDKYGNLQQFQAQLHESCNETIPPHTKVVLLSYDASEDVFFAMPAQQLLTA